MRIAGVGRGISGLGAAHVLSRAHQVEVLERDTRAGGHANTVVHDGLALATQRHLPAMFILRAGGEWRSQSTPEFERYRKM